MSVSKPSHEDRIIRNGMRARSKSGAGREAPKSKPTNWLRPPFYGAAGRQRGNSSLTGKALDWQARCQKNNLATTTTEPHESRPPERPKLGVATPLANEEGSINLLLDGVLAHLQPQDRFFCVLDNVCKDGTKAIVTERAARDPRVVLVWSPQNRCVVDAYFAGYRAAMNDGCEWILEMDGGMNHRPDQIPRFIEKMSQGYDFVGGSRYLPSASHKSPLNRVLVSKGGSVLAKLVLGAKMTDMTSGFECFNRKTLGRVLEKGVQSRANFFQTEIRWMMHEYRWAEVPINYENTNFRIGRSSIREAFRLLWQMRRAEKQKRKLA